ncbi:MAG: 4Fe-4S binding protein [Coriobacteriales bacterium]|nr:4Fe-4S binding protein [Coriobacteriales bacterium]
MTPAQPETDACELSAGGLARFKRRIIQLLAALLFNLNLPGFASGSIYKGATKAICAPGLNCYSCPGAVTACPIGALQSSLAAADHKLPLYIVGTVLAFGALFGRTICGWLCPFGLIQELLDKIPLPKLAKGAWSRTLSRLKYLILALTVIILPTVLASPTFCAWLCPAGTLEAGLPIIAANPAIRASLGGQFVFKASLLALFVLASAVIYRPFCRFLCPLGALYSFFNRFALLRYRVDPARCTHCGVCSETCKMDVKQVSDAECIQCGSCVGKCQQCAIGHTLAGLRQTGKTGQPATREDS